MQAFLINLPSAVARRAKATEALTKSEIPYTIVEAIYGKNINYPIAEFNEFGYILRQGRRRIDAEVGCYLSHIKALKLFLDSDTTWGLILEDDALVPSHLKDILDHAIATNTFDMLRLSTVNSGRWTKTIPIYNGYFLGVAFTREKGAGAYLVNKQAAQKMVNGFLPMNLPYDHRFDLEWLHGYRTAGITPSPVKQDGFNTQIQVSVRSYYLPAWLRYWTVFPYRFFLENTRFFYRLYRFFNLKIKVFKTR